MNTTRGMAVARGLIAFIALVALLFGLPIALVVFGSSLLPEHLVFSLSGIGRALTSPDSGGRLFMQALVLIGALGWASFAVSVLVEIPAQLRRRPTIRIRGLGWSQSAAATLITSITVMLAAPLAPLASAAPAHAQTVATSSAIAGVAAPAQASAAKAAPAASTTYTVEPHDTLWGIAEKLLGAGERYPEIAALNEGHAMAGGAVFHTDGFLQPGWHLRVPARTEPAAAAPTTAPAPAGAHEVTVRPGDSLSKIAGQEYGDPDLYPVLEQANLGHVEAGGERFTDPDLIRPGWVLQVPALSVAPTAPKAPPSTAKPPTTAPTTAVTTPATAPATSTPAPSATTQAAPSAAASSPAASSPAGAVAAGPSAGATTEAGPATAAPTSGASTAAGNHESSPAGEDSSAVATVLGICGLTAAGVLGLLAFKRSRQQRNRRPGRRIRMPQAVPPPIEGDADVRLRMTATADPADLTDRALRTLGARCAETGQPVPDLTDVLVDGAGLHLRLANPAPAAWPFTADGRIWSLDPEAELLDDQACAEVSAPYPGLVAVGQTGADGQLLLDVESCRLLAVDGGVPDVEHVLRALLIELATSRTAGELTLVAVGLDELAAAIGGPRVQIASTVTSALHRLGNHAESTAAAMADLQLPDLRTARAAGGAEAANWTPLIVVCGHELDGDETARAARVLQQFPFAPIALIAPAGDLLAAFPSAQVLQADPEVRPWPGLPGGLLAQRLDDVDYPQILEHLTIANDTSDIPAQPWSTEAGRFQPEQVWHGWEQQAAAIDPQIPAVWATATVAAHATDAGSPSALPAALGSGWFRPEEQGFRLADIVSGVDEDEDFDDGEEHSDHADDQTRPDHDDPEPAPWLTALQFGGPLADLGDDTYDDGQEDDRPQDQDGASNGDLAAPGQDTGEEIPGDGAEDGPAQNDVVQDGTEADGVDGTAGEDSAAADGDGEQAPVAPLRGHPQVRLLGPVDVVGVDGTVDDSRRDRYTEMAAFLVLNPGAGHEQFSEALWPGGVTQGSRNTDVSRLRTWFAHHPDGTPYLPPIRKNGYRFHPEVGCDWLEFQRLVHTGALRGADGIPELVAALKLVRGKPLTGIDPGRYAWADTLQQYIISEIADAAMMVAEARLAAGDPRAALEAALIGISAGPEQERLHRARFMAAGRLGDDDELARAAKQLEDMLADCDANMQPETRELYRGILEQRRRARQAAG